MKQNTKQLNIKEINKKAFVLAVIFSFIFVPNFAFADFGGDFGGWTTSDYDNSWTTSNYDNSWTTSNYDNSWTTSDYDNSWTTSDYDNSWTTSNYDNSWTTSDYDNSWTTSDYYRYEPTYTYTTEDFYEEERIDYYEVDYGSYEYYPTYTYSYDYPTYSYSYEYPRRNSYSYRTYEYPEYRYRTIAQSSNNLNVRCELSDSTIEEGDYVTIEVDIDGGDSPYDIEWDGDIDDIDDFDDNDRSQRVQFDDEGRYDLEVRVEDDDGNVDTDTCTVFVEEDNNNDFEIQCEISDTRIEEGDYVTIEVDIDGGDSPYDIEWDGDIDDIDDFDDNDRSQRVQFDDEGRYDIDVRVEDDDGNVETDTCPVIIVDDDNDINVFTDLNNPSGDLASVDSVFLSQVPYTGPAEDAAKVLGFISVLLLWSGIVAFIFVKRREKQERSMQIEAFKQANLNR